MTRNAVPSYVVYAGNNAVGSFAIAADGEPIWFRSNDDLIVVERVVATGATTVLVEGTDYDVTGGPSAGILTRTAGNLPTGNLLCILRQGPLSQETDFGLSGDWNSSRSTVTDTFDRLIEIIQDISDHAIRSDSFAANGQLPVLGTDLDINGHTILNLPVPANPSDPLRLADLQGFVGGTFPAMVTLAGAQTLTNKIINATLNTFSNLTTAMFAPNVVDTDAALTANSDTRLASQKAVKAYISSFITSGIAYDTQYVSLNAAVAAIGATQKTLVVTSGQTLTANLTIPSNIKLVVQLGGSIIKASTYTLAINGPLIAERYQIFSGFASGNVTINPQFTSVGYPEWWGAVSNSSGTDCLAAINACIVAMPISELQLADYYVSGTVLMQTAHRKLRGIVRAWTSGGGTRIICTSGSANVLLMGLPSNPSSINAQLQHVYVEDLVVTRNATIVSTATAYGIINQYTLFSGIKRVEAIEHKVGFYYNGAVQPHTEDCYAFRSTVGTVPLSDSFYGYLLAGGSGITAAGGNASVYFRDNTAACGLSSANCPTNIGYGLAGPSADTYINGGEVSGTLQGLVIVGSGTTSGDADIHIRGLVLDGMRGAQGILINGYTGALSLYDNYVAPDGAGTAGFVCLAIVNSRGVVTGKNQFICWPLSGSIGIDIDTCPSISIGDDVIVDAHSPLIVNATNSSRFTPVITNYGVTTTNPAVAVSGASTRNVFAAMANGASSAFASGYNLASNTSNANEINCSGLNPGAISGGSGNKLIYNGSQVTTTGVVSSNWVTGYMA